MFCDEAQQRKEDLTAHLLVKLTTRNRSTLSAAWQLSWITVLQVVSLQAMLTFEMRMGF
jgi:hypothetical protein